MCPNVSRQLSFRIQQFSSSQPALCLFILNCCIYKCCRQPIGISVFHESMSCTVQPKISIDSISINGFLSFVRSYVRCNSRMPLTLPNRFFTLVHTGIILHHWHGDWKRDVFDFFVYYFCPLNVLYSDSG